MSPKERRTRLMERWLSLSPAEQEQLEQAAKYSTNATARMRARATRLTHFKSWAGSPYRAVLADRSGWTRVASEPSQCFPRGRWHL